MGLFLGIDGGGSGCRAALSDAEGRILGRGTGGPANINTNLENAAESIMSAANEALQSVGAGPGDVTATLGLAGGMMRNATARLAEMLPFGRTQIVNDAIITARGALGGDDGILAALGTGSVYAVQRNGRITQRGGRGFILGDDAGGAVLGRSLLSQVLRAEDEFAPMTPLLREISAEFGGIQGIIEFANTARPADFGRLAPRIVDSEDHAAQQILAQATQDVLHVLTTLQQGENLPVVFAGGLGKYYAARLAGHDWPIIQPRGGAVEGALDMARQMENSV